MKEVDEPSDGGDPIPPAEIHVVTEAPQHRELGFLLEAVKTATSWDDQTLLEDIKKPVLFEFNPLQGILNTFHGKIKQMAEHQYALLQQMQDQFDEMQRNLTGMQANFEDAQRRFQQPVALPPPELDDGTKAVLKRLSMFAEGVEAIGGLGVVQDISSCIYEAGGQKAFAANLRAFNEVARMVGGPDELADLLNGMKDMLQATGGGSDLMALLKLMAHLCDGAGGPGKLVALLQGVENLQKATGGPQELATLLATVQGLVTAAGSAAALAAALKQLTDLGVACGGQPALAALLAKVAELLAAFGSAQGAASLLGEMAAVVQLCGGKESFAGLLKALQALLDSVGGVDGLVDVLQALKRMLVECGGLDGLLAKLKQPGGGVGISPEQLALLQELEKRVKGVEDDLDGVHKTVEDIRATGRAESLHDLMTTLQAQMADAAAAAAAAKAEAASERARMKAERQMTRSEAGYSRRDMRPTASDWPSSTTPGEALPAATGILHQKSRLNRGEGLSVKIAQLPTEPPSPSSHNAFSKQISRDVFKLPTSPSLASSADAGPAHSERAVTPPSDSSASQPARKAAKQLTSVSIKEPLESKEPTEDFDRAVSESGGGGGVDAPSHANASSVSGGLADDAWPPRAESPAPETDFTSEGAAVESPDTAPTEPPESPAPTEIEPAQPAPASATAPQAVDVTQQRPPTSAGLRTLKTLPSAVPTAAAGGAVPKEEVLAPKAAFAAAAPQSPEPGEGSPKKKGFALFKAKAEEVTKGVRLGNLKRFASEALNARFHAIEAPISEVMKQLVTKAADSGPEHTGPSDEEFEELCEKVADVEARAVDLEAAVAELLAIKADKSELGVLTKIIEDLWKAVMALQDPESDEGRGVKNVKARCISCDRPLNMQRKTALPELPVASAMAPQYQGPRGPGWEAAPKRALYNGDYETYAELRRGRSSSPPGRSRFDMAEPSPPKQAPARPATVQENTRPGRVALDNRPTTAASPNLPTQGQLVKERARRLQDLEEATSMSFKSAAIAELHGPKSTVMRTRQ